MKKGLLPILGRVPVKEQKQDRQSVPEELHEESWNFSTSGIHLRETKIKETVAVGSEKGDKAFPNDKKLLTSI